MSQGHSFILYVNWCGTDEKNQGITIFGVLDAGFLPGSERCDVGFFAGR